MARISTVVIQDSVDVDKIGLFVSDSRGRGFEMVSCMFEILNFESLIAIGEGFPFIQAMLTLSKSNGINEGVAGSVQNLFGFATRYSSDVLTSKFNFVLPEPILVSLDDLHVEIAADDVSVPLQMGVTLWGDFVELTELQKAIFASKSEYG